MATPGENANVIREVVKGELYNQSPPSQFQPEHPIPPNLAVNPSPNQHSYHVLLPPAGFTQPVQTSSSDMGVLARRSPCLPIGAHEELGTIVTPTSVSPPVTGKTETFGLEQRTLENYYQQSKFYPPATPIVDYPLPAYPSTATLTPIKPYLLPSPLNEQPGPSGLQTPKTSRSTSSIYTTSTSTAGHVAKIRKRSRPTLPAEGERKIHRCRICHKNFNSLEKLCKHEQTHIGSSQYKCENCKKNFSSKFKLVRHALIHSDRKPFSCSVCDRTFHRKDHLKNHIKVHSPQKEIFICNKEGCKKQYTSFLSFRKHQAIHAAEEGNLICQICLLSFTSKDEIMFHLKIHAGSRTVKNPSERKFTCDQCDRRFFTKKDVRRHLVVHTGMRDFLCQFCPQRFGRKDHLVRHIKKSHSTKYKPAETLTTAFIKTEPVTSKHETSVVSDLDIKSEFSESSISNPEAFAPSLVDLEFLPDDFSQLDSQLFLPSTSEQEELKDLGSGILEGIEESPSISTENVVMDDPTLLQQMFETAPANRNLPLPGFSQTFHSQPAPKQGPSE